MKFINYEFATHFLNELTTASTTTPTTTVVVVVIAVIAASLCFNTS